MSMCVVTGKACQCQPEEGFPCPGVEALRAQVERLQAGGGVVVPLKRIPSDGDAFAVMSNGNGYRIEGVRDVEDEFCRINGLTVGGGGAK